MDHVIFFLHLTALIMGVISNIFLLHYIIEHNRRDLFSYTIFWINFTILFLYNFLSSYIDVTGFELNSVYSFFLYMGFILKISLNTLAILTFMPEKKSMRAVGRRKIITVFLFLPIIYFAVRITTGSNYQPYLEKSNSILDILLLAVILTITLINLAVNYKNKSIRKGIMFKANWSLLLFSGISLFTKVWSLFVIREIFILKISFIFLCYYILWSIFLIRHIGKKNLFRRKIPSLDDIDEQVFIRYRITPREKDILKNLCKRLEQKGNS